MKIPKEIEFTEEFEIRTNHRHDHILNEIYTLHIQENVDSIELKFIGENGQEISNTEEVLEYLYYLRLEQ